ncbi:MAG: cardiolipin synthase [Muribaculaceae bacterium]|nr:cardiolipin synthase [Muribaculaceae bacterium]
MYPIVPDFLQGYGWISTVVGLLYVATVLGLIAVILSENRNPVKTLAWTMVLLLLPFVGIVLYVFFGRNIKNKRMISRRNRRRLRRHEKRSGYDPRREDLSLTSLQVISTASSLDGAQYYAGNSVEVFTDGRSKFDALREDIRRARSYINIQYYIFEDDSLGTEFAELLMAKAREGVQVRLLYDHVGSFNVSNGFFRRLREAGIETHPFFRVSIPQLGSRINWRNHRKVCVIDGTVGYVGGMNVAERYVSGGKFPVWRDTHVRVIGPVVASLAYSFAVDWNFTSGELIVENAAPDGRSMFEPGLGAVKGVGAQFLTSGPTSQWSNIAMTFHRAIASARRRVYIQTPYFLPTEGLMRALQTAALAHVDVRLMVPERSDSKMLTHATASYLEECLRAGVRVYRYTAGMLHAKTIVIDDEICTIGSTNFDFRSFDYNFESNLFFYSKEFNGRIAKIFMEDLAFCKRITASQWRRRPKLNKITESIVRLLSPIL